MHDELKRFAFKGFLLRHAVKDMESTGLVHKSENTATERREADLFAPVTESIRSGSLQMQYCYRLLFVLENVIRELISSRFAEIDGADWFDKRASSPMKTTYETRKAKEERNAWHTGRNKHPIYYLDFSDLSRLLINHWTVFEDLLPNQSWAQSRLDDAEKTRNVIAHTNILSAEEIARLEMYLRDWMKQIG
jgi:hypothetical protein